jgi:hypothetical protein
MSNESVYATVSFTVVRNLVSLVKICAPSLSSSSYAATNLRRYVIKDGLFPSLSLCRLADFVMASKSLSTYRIAIRNLFWKPMNLYSTDMSETYFIIVGLLF